MCRGATAVCRVRGRGRVWIEGEGEGRVGTHFSQGIITTRFPFFLCFTIEDSCVKIFCYFRVIAKIMKEMKWPILVGIFFIFLFSSSILSSSRTLCFLSHCSFSIVFHLFHLFFCLMPTFAYLSLVFSLMYVFFLLLLHY